MDGIPAAAGRIDAEAAFAFSVGHGVLLLNPWRKRTESVSEGVDELRRAGRPSERQCDGSHECGKEDGGEHGWIPADDGLGQSQEENCKDDAGLGSTVARIDASVYLAVGYDELGARAMFARLLPV